MKEFKIVPIRNGSVLDHIDAGTALQVLEAIGHPVRGSSKVVSLSMNLPSGRGGLKDVLKFEDVELGPDDLRRVQAISKSGTLSVIRNYDIAQKTRWGAAPHAQAPAKAAR